MLFADVSLRSSDFKYYSELFSMKLVRQLGRLFAAMILFAASTASFGQNDSVQSLLEKARQGDGQAYDSILESAQRGNKRALDALIAFADEGHVGAQNELGIMYSEAKGVKPNQRRAVYWFRRSAELGYAIGTCNLGLHYGYGWGVRRNPILMMKYVFAAHALDGLKCSPADYMQFFKPRPSECQIEKGWQLAVAWLKAHHDFKNNFDEQPWMEENGEYPITVRENAPTVELPPEQKGKCRPARRLK